MATPIVIYTDSASDVTPQERQEWNVGLIPLSLTCGADSFLDDHSVPMAQLWERMEAGETLTTSQPSLQTFMDVFEKAKAQGQALLYISLSSALSGTYQTARAASTMVDYEEIYIVDGRQAAGAAAEKLLVLRACALRDEGKLTAGEIARELERYRARVRLFACINTLEYLVRGGRLSKLAGNFGSLLNIKPIIGLTPDGAAQVVKKAPGFKRAVSELCALVTAQPMDPTSQVIPIFARDDTNCRAFLAQLKERFGLNVTTPPQEIGATIGCHIGPGGFGLVYAVAEA